MRWSLLVRPVPDDFSVLELKDTVRLSAFVRRHQRREANALPGLRSENLGVRAEETPSTPPNSNLFEAITKAHERPASRKASLTTDGVGAFRYGSIAWKESQPPTCITTRGFI